MGIDDLRKRRVEKLKSFNKLGIDPYSVRFNTDKSIKDIISNFKEKQDVSCAGRIMTIRQHGKIIFSDLASNGYKIQLYFSQKDLNENFDFFNKLDVGDIIGVSGSTFKTRTGELTIQVKEFKLLSKSLRPIPEKWHGLKDVEERYRKRYLDLISNDEVKEFFLIRSKMITKIREFFDNRGYLEVETPMLHSIPGGASGDPFKTHLNVYDMDLYLRIAPELYLKKLLVGGYEKVYEINRSFRNEGVSTRHNPEFTMLEAYLAYADYEDMMKLTQDLVVFLAKEILGKTKIIYQGHEIDLTPGWDKMSFAKAMKDSYEVEPSDSASVLKKKLKKKGISFEGKKIPRSQIINIISDLIEPTSKTSNKPVFVVDFYTEISPLAKTKPDNPLLVERFEMFMGGLEMANAYSELNDPIEQKNRFKKQFQDDKEAKIDEDFILALEYGMPPAGGLGIGIDRLVMLFTDNPTIRNVILFPQLKSR